MSAGNIKLYTESNLSQQLNLAPQLLNWLRLLQASTLDLSQMVRTELDSNPALECVEPESDPYDLDTAEVDFEYDKELKVDDDSVADRLSMLAEIDEDWSSADQPQRLAENSVMQERHDYMMDHIVKPVSLFDELNQAITYADLNSGESMIAMSIAGSIDGRGYLCAPVRDLADQMGLEIAEFRVVLEKFQDLAPAGIGAEDLRDCLMLQLKAIPQNTQLAEILVCDWLENLAQGQEEGLAEHLGVDVDDIHSAFGLIRSLDPEPGRYYTSSNVEYVDADLEIYEEDGELKIDLCEAHLPRLSISKYCKRLLEAKNGTKKDMDYIRQKILSANFLIQGISQRQETLLKVGKQILRVQKEFLEDSSGQLKVLTMNKVAAIIGVHETTVSRAIANKYIRTPRGLFEMRKFFKVGYRCADGSFVTPERIKEQMEHFIAEEDEFLPLTDLQITELFKKKGVKVARRTVAKYREELGVPSSKERLARARKRKMDGLAVAI